MDCERHIRRLLSNSQHRLMISLPSVLSKVKRLKVRRLAMNLYEISAKYQAILSHLIDDETGEINVEQGKLLEVIKDDVYNKAIAVASYIKNLDAERYAIE